MRKLFLFLCAALMSVGAMAQTETLLTTITATGVEQANYSTEGVATVSFSYTAGGSSTYIALWGWWGYGWSATVNAAEGYTITKCVFYDDQDRTATDSEAPFVVETTEEDKTPKVNGTPILKDTSRGIKKIEVYGYATPEPEPQPAATVVTITDSDFPAWGESFTKDGVTVSALAIDGMYGNISGPGSFSTTLGNFTKIEVSAASISVSGEGWSGDSEHKTWTGNASSVSFIGDINGYEEGTTLKFTIAESTVAVTGVTLNQNEAQMTVGGETLTLTATVNPNNATDQSVSWSTSDANVATVENGVVTAVAAGNATITVTTTDGSFTATCAVTVTAPEPQVERELTKLGFNFPSENIPADNDIEMAGTFEEGTMWMEKIIATGWFVSYDFVNAAEDETFKLRSKSNNDLVLCQFIPANNGEGGKWVQAIFTFGNYWSDDTWKGTPCKLIEEDLSDAAQYAWMEGMPEPLPEGIEHIVLTEKAQKVIMDGMIYIVRDGKLFNLTGAQVK